MIKILFLLTSAFILSLKTHLTLKKNPRLNRVVTDKKTVRFSNFAETCRCVIDENEKPTITKETIYVNFEDIKRKPKRIPQNERHKYIDTIIMDESDESIEDEREGFAAKQT